jgi:homoserine kinase
VPERMHVSAPASAANLGPGFDCLAVALELRNEVTISPGEGDRVEVTVEGEGVRAASRGADNLFVRAFRAAGADARGLRFEMRNRIPFYRGLGSSAATISAGVAAGLAWTGRDADPLPAAVELEGHPDNVAASLHGGFVIGADGQATRFDPPAGLEAVVVVPRSAVRTKTARAALPAEVPMADAVFNTAHGALLVLGLARGDWDLVARGLEDRLHQPRREHLYPRSMNLVRAARSFGALGATISGAGPTVLVWCHYEATASVVEALRREAEGWAQVMRVPFEPQGADVREL